GGTHRLQLLSGAPGDADATGLAVLALDLFLADPGGLAVRVDDHHVGDVDGLHYIAALDAGAGDGVLHGGDDDVTDPCVAAPRASEDPDAQNLLGTGVVGDTQSRLLLDHVGSPTWPSRGSPPVASAWSLTTGGSPSAGRGHRRRRCCS